MDVGKAAGLVLAAAVFSLAAPATAQRVEPSTDSDRAAAADAAAVQAYVAARQQADASAPEAILVETVSGAVQQVTHWIELSGDNNGLPFIVVDKLRAEVFVFDAQGQPLGKAPALLGISLGDGWRPVLASASCARFGSPIAQRRQDALSPSSELAVAAACCGSTTQQPSRSTRSSLPVLKSTGCSG